MPRLIDTLDHKPNELKFGTSGLRGLASDMTDLECYINTLGFLHFLHEAGDYAPGGQVFLAGDLRSSTPRILRAVHRAITDASCQTVYCGLIPTPAVAYYGLLQKAPSIMVTGSHIPADRNGIKFNKTTGEVMKEDETGIKAAVAEVRAKLYAEDSQVSAFDSAGMLKQAADLPAEVAEAREAYIGHYTDVFSADALGGREIVFYQHSAVGRDLLVEILRRLGATVATEGRSEVFVPIDTENVTPQDDAYFKKLAASYPQAFAIVSTDGDSDRPFVIDAGGNFHRGDVLGAVVAEWLDADAAAFPVSTSDAATAFLDDRNIAYAATRIGSPYVISGMQAAAAAGRQRVVGWEVNGGFMLGSDMPVQGGTLRALPTRDALLPIIVALLAAVEKNVSVSELFARLPARATQAGLIDDFPTEVSQEILRRYAQDTPEVRTELGQYFDAEHGFGGIINLNTVDGIRIFFDNGDIAHMRPSGNAPQLRIYSVSDSQPRADAIVALALAEPDGIFRRLQRDLSSS